MQHEYQKFDTKLSEFLDFSLEINVNIAEKVFNYDFELPVCCDIIFEESAYRSLISRVIQGFNFIILFLI